MKKAEKIEVLKVEFAKLNTNSSKALYKLCMDLGFSYLVYNAVKKELNLTTEEKKACPVKDFFEYYNEVRSGKKDADTLVGLKNAVANLEQEINEGLDFKYTGALASAKKTIEFFNVKITNREEFVQKQYDFYETGFMTSARLVEILNESNY